MLSRGCSEQISLLNKTQARVVGAYFFDMKKHNHDRVQPLWEACSTFCYGRRSVRVHWKSPQPVGFHSSVRLRTRARMLSR